MILMSKYIMDLEILDVDAKRLNARVSSTQEYELEFAEDCLR